MKTLLTLGTGSTGNCYLLSDDDSTLILDAGVNENLIKGALHYDFSTVSGVLITHNHKDHSASADKLEKYGLDVFRPYLVDGCRDKRTFGKWAIQSFDLPHDGEPCSGFFIRHIDGFKMLYLTDLEYCRYVFKNQEINVILIECNWQKEFVEKEAANYSHKVLGHLSLDNAIGFLKANKTDALQKVIICHQSMWTMDEEECIDRIRQEIGVDVEAAKKERTIEL
jgi:ribonuclease BN (tRNA processing enzyme)